MPELMADVLAGTARPVARCFDLTVGLDDVAEGYAAMDERRAIKMLCGSDSRAGGAPMRRSHRVWEASAERRVGFTVWRMPCSAHRSRTIPESRG